MRFFAEEQDGRCARCEGIGNTCIGKEDRVFSGAGGKPLSEDEKSIVPGADELFEPETIAKKKALMQLESLKGDTAEAKRMRKAFAKQR